MDDLIAKYLDPKHPGSLGGIDRLLRSTEKNEDKSSVLKALQHVDAYTLNKENRRTFPRNPVVVTNLQHQYQIDLADLSKYAEQNDGVRYLLVAIDCFSKKACVQPLITKEELPVKNALEKVFKELGVPHKIQFDKGTEFWNSTVQKYLRQKQVEMFTSENDDIKCCMAERLIRTLKSRIFRFFRFRLATRYIDKLQDFVYSYNHSVHSSHGQEPASVKHSNSLKTFNALYGSMLREQIKHPRYKVGDVVRIAKNKGQFEKGYDYRFQSDFYTVTKLIGHQAPVYKLKETESDEPIKGSFYESELSIVKGQADWEYRVEKVLERKRRGKVWWIKVRWLGYGAASDSWVKEKCTKIKAST